MRTDSKKWMLLAVILLIGTAGYTQYRSNSSPAFLEGLSVTGKAALNMFYGDLVDLSRISYFSGAGGSVEKEILPYLSLRAQIMAGNMKGTQLQEGIIFSSFTNSYVEATIGGTYTPLNQLMGFYRERRLQPYALLQGGVISYNSVEKWGPAGYGVEMNEDVWRTASGVAPVVGLGGGVSIWVIHRFRINLEFVGAYAFSDQIDAHDTWFVWPDVDNHYKTKSNDFYYTGTVGISYTFKDSKFRNDTRFTRRTYERSRQSFTKKSNRSSSYKRPRRRR